MEIRAFNTRKKWNNASKKGFLKSKLFQLNLSAFGVEKLLMFKKKFQHQLLLFNVNSVMHCMAPLSYIVTDSKFIFYMNFKLRPPGLLH